MKLEKTERYGRGSEKKIKNIQIEKKGTESANRKATRN